MCGNKDGGDRSDAGPRFRLGGGGLTVIALAALACGTKRPGGREEDDPMHHRLKKEGGELRRWLGGKDDGDGRRFAPVRFTADAVGILVGRNGGGRFLRRGDLTGWAHYVFLDDSVERHPYNCRYVRALRFLRGVRATGGVS